MKSKKAKKEKVVPATKLKKKKKKATGFGELALPTVVGFSTSLAKRGARDVDFKKAKRTPDNTGVEVGHISDFSSSRRRVQRDSRIATLIETADGIQISTELESELRQFYTTARDVKVGTYSYMGVDPDFTNPRKNQIRIAKAMLKIQAYRDRVLDIQTVLLGFSNKLQSAKRLAVELIHERFGEELKKRGALTVQSVFIDAVIEPIIEKRELVDMYLKRTDLILKNLDNSHFTYREVGQIGNSIISRAEGAYGSRN